MKKRVLSLVLLLITCFSMSISASAQETPIGSVLNKSDSQITIFADVIEIKTRIYNGKLQYRRWNQTWGYWVDPYWKYF